MAAAIYDENNRLVASFARAGESIRPVAIPRGRTTVFQDGRLYVVRPVQEAGQTLGTARLRLLDTPASQRFSRYAGLMLVLGLAGLVVNARDAMPNGGRIILSAHNATGEDGAPDMVCLRVADTGTGMSEAVSSRGVRALLHHQGSGPRHRAGPVAGLWLRALVGR